MISSARQRVCARISDAPEPEERHVGSMIRRPQARKRSYGSGRPTVAMPTKTDQEAAEPQKQSARGEFAGAGAAR